MPHYPKPFFKKARGLWYVEIDRKQINLGPNRDEAFRRYHGMMAQPRGYVAPTDSFAAIADTFLEWVERNRSPDTYEWYRYRLQRFLTRYPNLLASEMRSYHVETWAAPGLAPNDDVVAIADVIEHEQGDIMLVGHLPFLERLAALLITGNSKDKVVTMEAGSLVELTRTDAGWEANCLMQPRLLPGT